jgi:hypothetical protein
MIWAVRSSPSPNMTSYVDSLHTILLDPTILQEHVLSQVLCHYCQLAIFLYLMVAFGLSQRQHLSMSKWRRVRRPG